MQAQTFRLATKLHFPQSHQTVLKDSPDKIDSKYFLYSNLLIIPMTLTAVADVLDVVLPAHKTRHVHRRNDNAIHIRSTYSDIHRLTDKHGMETKTRAQKQEHAETQTHMHTRTQLSWTGKVLCSAK